MINDKVLMKAVSSILQRSEKQQEHDKLIGSFVDVGTLSQLTNNNNQIVIGRRGTGKTHVFKVLLTELQKYDNNIVVYIDARTLGSTNQIVDEKSSKAKIGILIFKDIIGVVHNSILDYVIDNMPEKEADILLDAVAKLRSVCTDEKRSIQENAIKKKTISKAHMGFNAGVSLSKDISLSLQGDNSNDDEVAIETSYDVSFSDNLIFAELNHYLKLILNKTQATLYLLIDEWSSVDMKVQPYLSELIKKGLIPNANITIKIASLEYRSNYGISIGKGNMLGFEVGADISSTLDIDDYFVYDRNPPVVIKSFADMLHRHINCELPDSYFKNQLNISDSKQFQSRLFTNKETFRELVRSSEGVPRDLINIFSIAYFECVKNRKVNIDKKSILYAARQWFEQDKERNLSEELTMVLRKIVDEVIGNRKSRSFLLKRELEKHDIIQGLFDARVLHLMRRGYADKDNPGVRYNIYTLDYGTYVDLLTTSKKPQLDLQKSDIQDDNEEWVVPFDDNRSIRRVIVTEEILGKQVK